MTYPKDGDNEKQLGEQLDQLLPDNTGRLKYMKIVKGPEMDFQYSFESLSE